MGELGSDDGVSALGSLARGTNELADGFTYSASGDTVSPARRLAELNIDDLIAGDNDELIPGIHPDAFDRTIGRFMADAAAVGGHQGRFATGLFAVRTR
jgi:hypothetical protein